MSDTADDRTALSALYGIAMRDMAMRDERLDAGPPGAGKGYAPHSVADAGPSECTSASEAATITQIGLGPGHVVVTLSGPGRVEVSAVDGRLLMFAYLGTETDVEQDPDAVYDSARA